MCVCGTITAFGVPVLPEVKIRYAIASGSKDGSSQDAVGSRSRAPSTVCRGKRARSSATSSCSGSTSSSGSV